MANLASVAPPARRSAVDSPSARKGAGSEVLFLTATIQPAAGTLHLAVSDPKERRSEYLAAFRLYAEMVGHHTDWRLLFVENSGADLGAFAVLADDFGIAGRTELCSVPANTQVRINRLALECELIGHAMTDAAMLQVDDARIWKITGRYQVRNLARFIARAPQVFDIYLNLRRFPRTALDFYLAGFSRRGLTVLIERLAGVIATPRTGEDVLFAMIERGEFGDLDLVPRYRVVPRIRGTCGYDGGRYDGLADTAKYGVRVIANTLAPRIWI